jgi:uncharacterized membrane protein YadS
MKVDFETSQAVSITFAMIAALFSPRLWIAVVAGLAIGLVVGPWNIWQALVEFGPDGLLILALVFLGLIVSFEAIVAALAVYCLKRAIGATWRRVTKKEPVGQFDNETP